MTQIIYRTNDRADFATRNYDQRADALIDFAELRDGLEEGGLLILTHKDKEPMIAYPPLTPVDSDDYGYRRDSAPVIADFPAESRLRHDFADGVASIDRLCATEPMYRYISDDARADLVRAAGESHERFLVIVLCRFFVVDDLTTIGRLMRGQDYGIDKMLEAFDLIGERYPSLAEAVAAERADFGSAQDKARQAITERNELQALRLRIHDDAVDALMAKIEPGDTGTAMARGYQRFVSVVKINRKRITVEYELRTTGEVKTSAIGPMDVEWTRQELADIVAGARKAIKDAAVSAHTATENVR